MKYKKIIFILILGTAIRLFFVNKWEKGDLLPYMEWGMKFWEYGAKNFYFGVGNAWDFSIPNYMPLGSLMFAGLYKLFEYKFVLAQLHNLIKIPPAFFIVYFYNYGQTFLLKLPSIISDIFLTLLIFYSAFKITKNENKALAASVFYLLNPASIFITSVWGQTDSLVTLFGFLAFLLLSLNKPSLSIVSYFLSLYIKPSWALFLPIYIFLIIFWRVNFKKLAAGLLVTFVLFVVTTLPFADRNLYSFTKKLYSHRMSYSSRSAIKTSVSSFNFQTIFSTIDRTPADKKLLVLSYSQIGQIVFLMSYVLSLAYLKKEKNKIRAAVTSLMIIGFGSYIFLPSMLERYFYPALPSLSIILFSYPNIFMYIFLINFVCFCSVIWSFFRRTSDELDHIFTSFNYLGVRILSLAITGAYLKTLNKFFKIPKK